MKRRAVLQWLAAVPGLRAWAQTAGFPGKHAGTLRGIAGIVLPGAVDANRVAEQFARWVREYRSGADMDHGYGFTRVRSKPPSPAPTYLAQLEALHEPNRQAIEAALEQAKISELPRSPDGKHVVADLMSFYFHGSDANDLCHRAAIGRDRCRGLEGSDNPPPPLKGIG